MQSSKGGIVCIMNVVIRKLEYMVTGIPFNSYSNAFSPIEVLSLSKKDSSIYREKNFSIIVQIFACPKHYLFSPQNTDTMVLLTTLKFFTTSPPSSKQFVNPFRSQKSEIIQSFTFNHPLTQIPAIQLQIFCASYIFFSSELPKLTGCLMFLNLHS